MHNVGGWAEDGRHLAFSANRRSPADFDVFVQDALDPDPAAFEITIAPPQRGDLAPPHAGGKGDHRDRMERPTAQRL